MMSLLIGVDPTLGYRFPVSIRSFQIYFPIWVQFGSSDPHTIRCEKGENRAEKDGTFIAGVNKITYKFCGIAGGERTAVNCENHLHFLF